MTFTPELEPCHVCKRTDYVCSVIVDGRRLCSTCKRRLVSEPAPHAEPDAKKATVRR